MILAKNISQNQQFGLLTAVSRVKVDGKTHISCKCVCGDESSYLPDPLRIGKRKRCDKCISASVKFNRKIKDLTGKRYGKLLVLGLDHSYSGRGTSWVCACDCGKTVTVNRLRFSANSKTHCGCVPQNYASRRKRTSAISMDSIRSFIASKDGVIVTIGDLGKIAVRCAQLHEWNTTIQSLNKGHWCSKCANLASRSKTLEFLKNLALNLGGQSLCDEDPPSMVKPYKWICKKGHEFTMTPTLIRKGRWCPKCRFKRENQIREIAESLTGEKFPQKGPKWLTNPKTKGRLRFDAYCEKLQLAIEYNGEFHYREPPYRGASLKSIKERDRIKKKLAKKHGVRLIVVPYTVKNLRTFLSKRIKLIDTRIIST